MVNIFFLNNILFYNPLWNRINPKKTLPVAAVLSALTVMVLYVIANIAYIAILPLDLYKPSDVVGIQVGVAAFGSAGAYIFAMLVACSAFGAINGATFSNSRLIVAEASDGVLLPRFIANLSGRSTPVNALIFNTIICCLLLIPGDFNFLADIYSFVVWNWYLITILALLWLRRIRPDAPRPFKVPIIFALIFLIAACFLLIFPLLGDDKSTLISCVVCVIFMYVIPFTIIYIRQRSGKKI